MLTEYRRDLHRIPETGWQVEKTAAYVKRVLSELPCEVFSPVGNALCAYFDFGKPETVAFRSDMDGLPVTEQTGLPFASEHAGRMHACGHDGHMAILLGLAQTLSKKPKTERNVLLIFEPAEETTGGAEAIVETGLFEKYDVRRVYGLHLWPGVEEGKVFSRAGGLMSRSCEVSVRFTGKSVHIARYPEGKDALYAAVRFIEAAYGYAAGKENCLLRFGKMASGEVRNAVSGETVLEGSLRCLDDKSYDEMRAALSDAAAQTERETGCAVEVRRTAGYPPVTNDAALLREAKTRFPIFDVEPTYITEDFSVYQRQVPGVFFFLGTGGEELLHSPRFDFNERVLETGLALFTALL
ncbi:MAG: amidohydrolase [Oscillospiraceae bacterium]|nr:amidohydrolase [Oscillospiraceae bacterium]